MNEQYVIKLLKQLPVLTTERLTMRPICRRDAKDMYEYCSIPEVTEYVTWEPHESLRFTKRHIRKIRISYRQGTFHDWALVTSDGKMIGTCGFTSFSFDTGACEIGYVVNPAYTNRSFATEAAMRLIRFAFEDLCAETVFARCMAGNAASRRVMEKCGMVSEIPGIPDAEKNGKHYRTRAFCIGREEFFELREAAPI